MIYGAAAILVWPLGLCSLGELPAPCASMTCFESLIPEALDASGIRQRERSRGVSGGAVAAGLSFLLAGLGGSRQLLPGKPGATWLPLRMPHEGDVWGFGG